MGYSNGLTVSYNFAALDVAGDIAVIAKLYPPSARYNHARIDLVSIYAVTAPTGGSTLLKIGSDSDDNAYFEFDMEDTITTATAVTFDRDDTTGSMLNSTIDLSAQGDDTAFLLISSEEVAATSAGTIDLVVVVTWY